MSTQNPESIPAVIFGGYKTALGVIRSLGRAGIPQFLISEHPDFSARSRWARCFPEGLLLSPSPSCIELIQV